MKYKIKTVLDEEQTYSSGITINSFTIIIINEIMVMKLVGFIVTHFPLQRSL